MPSEKFRGVVIFRNMKTEMNRIPKSSSWPKTIVKKWLNMTSGDFHSDSNWEDFTEVKRRKSCSDKNKSILMRRHISSDWLVESSGNFKLSGTRKGIPSSNSVPPMDNLSMFVGTWNVGGRAPYGELNIKDWLMSTPCCPADIYVLGFQEIVPLNAGNVLGAEDRGPPRKWLSLIRQALNPNEQKKSALSFSIKYGSATRAGSKSDQLPRVSFSDLLSMAEDSDEEAELAMSSNPSSSSGEESPDISPAACGNGYVLVASKQMVGVFLCVWVRADLIRHVTSVKVSCVGRGIMGYMGNKGSISISMTLQKATFCFVCTHLASGQKDGDEQRRNSDVTEIMKRTRFPPSQMSPTPETILEHDKVIWLGDLNYRLSATCNDTYELLKRNEWQALLQKDQLHNEQRAGRVFAEWEEGRINFPPTYKYLSNSDVYAVYQPKSKEKMRIPAWCDRILWRGKGMKQVLYARGESQFSDHRPVYALFSIQINEDCFDRKMTSAGIQKVVDVRHSCTGSRSTTTAINSSGNNRSTTLS